MRGDSRRDNRVVLARGAALGENAAKEREEVLLLGGQLGEVAANVEVGDAIRGLGIELDPRLAGLRVVAGHVFERGNERDTG